MEANQTLKSTSKPKFSKEDRFLYSYLNAAKTPVVVKLSSDRKLKGVIRGLNTEYKVIILNDEVIDIKSIKKMIISDKKAKADIVKGMRSLFHLSYFDRFKNKTIFIESLDRKNENAKFIDYQKYQILTDYKGKLVLYYKAFISAFSFIKPYPRKLFTITDEVEKVIPGKWREEYKEIQEIWDEELNDTDTFYVEIALKDGRDVKGYLKKTCIFPSNIRIFENPKLKGKSLFIMNHSIADIIDIIRV